MKSTSTQSCNTLQWFDSSVANQEPSLRNGREGDILSIHNLQDVTSSCYHRETLKESHDYMFIILDNYHCWRFHGSGMMQGFEIVG